MKRKKIKYTAVLRINGVEKLLTRKEEKEVQKVLLKAGIPLDKQALRRNKKPK